MNEEELKKGCGKEAGLITFTDDFGNKDGDVMLCGETAKKINGEIELFLCDTCKARLEGFQKGKLEQKKEELEWLKTMNELSFICPECERSFVLKNFRLVNRIKQLQKEIGGNPK